MHKNAARVQPPRTFLTEYLFPIDVTFFKLRDSGVAAVGTAQCRTHPKATLGKVHSVAHVAADSVVLDPFDVRLIDSALIDEILDEPADGIVRKRSHDRRIEAEASFETACYVIFATAFPDVETPRCVNSPVTGIEPQHHFAEADDVPFAVIFWLNIQHDETGRLTPHPPTVYDENVAV